MKLSATEQALVARLRQLPATGWDETLDRACADDPGLLDRRPIISAALAAAEPAPTLPSGGEAARVLGLALEPAAGAETSGLKVGSYKLLQKIGEGGFGTVWMAEQLEPIRRHVAVKIIKLGMDTEEVITRFEAERQALALMDHPNIARVIDAGATEAGRPYFVMELVRGIAITRYCDENRLPAEARLRLFITVCQAVQHAHQKGIIHRDLKPSNILVTMHDGVPVPKIIDFGIVKATSARLTERTLFTQFHAFIGTPAYTSPEQMELSGLDIDTRSDIYSLGVLLYELLTGHLPFDSDALMKSGLEAMRRTIRETDPARPSNRLGALSEVSRTAVAHQRGTDAGKLSLLLRGDLDWIAMRCLEKDRTRRYDSATSLAADIERHLADTPVLARPVSRLYLARKFVRRHRLAVVATAAVAGSLIAGLVTSSTLLLGERAAHRRATIAEMRENDLRRQAEAARTDEVKRAARTALDLANRNLADGRVADGLAYLVYAARKDPTNATLAPRLASVLASHPFLLPLSAAFEGRSRVLAAQFTKDGHSIFIGTEDGTFRVLDAASGAVRREFRLGRDVMLGGWEFAPENADVIGIRFTDNTFTVLDAVSGKTGWTIPVPNTVGTMTERLGLGHPAGLSPDGRWVFAWSFDHFWLWEVATGLLRLDQSFTERISGCAFSARGGELALALGNSIRRWTLPDCRPVTAPITIELPPNASVQRSTWFIRYSPDSSRLAAANPLLGVQVFDTVSGKRARALPPPDSFLVPPSVVFGAPDRLFGAGNRSAGWWNLNSGEFTKLPIPAVGAETTMTFDATGTRVLIKSADGYVRICDLPGGTLATELTWRQPATYCAALSPDGTQLVIATAAGVVQRLRLGRGPARPLALPRPASPRMPALFVPEAGARLLWLTGERARVFEVASGRESAGGFSFPEPVSEPALMESHSPMRADHKFMVVRTRKDEWQAWSLGAGGVTHVTALAAVPSGGPHVISFSPRGDRVEIVSGTPRELGVWDLATGARAAPPFRSAANIVYKTPNFSPDGRRVALGTDDGASMIIELATARTVVTFATRPLVPNESVWLSPDGSRVVTSNIQTESRLWNAHTGEPISPVLPSPDPGGLSRFSPDGRHFASWGAHTTQLHDGETGARLGEEIPAGGKAVRFSRDGRSLVTCGTEGEAQVWDVPTGQALTEPLQHLPSDIVNPELSPDGRFLRTEMATDVLTKSGEANIYLWSVPPRLPAGAAIPEWLLQLATICASKTVNDAGQLVEVTDASTQLDSVRRELAVLPADAPLSDWGRWVLSDEADRPIAPGFTITPAEADRLAAALAGATTSK